MSIRPQKSRDKPVMHCPEPKTTGGNSTLTNGDEAVTLDAKIEHTPSKAELPGYAETGRHGG